MRNYVIEDDHIQRLIDFEGNDSSTGFVSSSYEEDEEMAELPDDYTPKFIDWLQNQNRVDINELYDYRDQGDEGWLIRFENSYAEVTIGLPGSFNSDTLFNKFESWANNLDTDDVVSEQIKNFGSGWIENQINTVGLRGLADSYDDLISDIQELCVDWEDEKDSYEYEGSELEENYD